MSGSGGARLRCELAAAAACLQPGNAISSSKLRLPPSLPSQTRCGHLWRESCRSGVCGQAWQVELWIEATDSLEVCQYATGAAICTLCSSPAALIGVGSHLRNVGGGGPGGWTAQPCGEPWASAPGPSRQPSASASRPLHSMPGWRCTLCNASSTPSISAMLPVCPVALPRPV